MCSPSLTKVGGAYQPVGKVYSGILSTLTSQPATLICVPNPTLSLLLFKDQAEASTFIAWVACMQPPYRLTCRQLFSISCTKLHALGWGPVRWAHAGLRRADAHLARPSSQREQLEWQPLGYLPHSFQGSFFQETIQNQGKQPVFETNDG